MLIEERGNTKMAVNKSNLMSGFMPQKLTSGIAMAFDGRLAIKRPNGDFVAYNPLTAEIENQSEFVFGEEMLSGMVYVMPSDKVDIGDLIVGNNGYIYVVDIEDGVTGVNLTTGVVNEIVTEKHVLFGKNMYKKVVSMLNMSGSENTMNPMMMMALLGDGDKKDMLPMMMMMGGMNGGADKGAMNPMMMMMMLDGKSGSDETLKMMLMMQMMQGGGFKF